MPQRTDPPYTKSQRADDGTAWDDDEGCYYSRPSQRDSSETLWGLTLGLGAVLVGIGIWALTMRIVECLS